MEKTGAALHANACKLPSGPDRDELLQDIEKFRAQVAVLQSAGPRSFCANQSVRLRVKFDGFHAALENAAY